MDGNGKPMVRQIKDKVFAHDAQADETEIEELSHVLIFFKE